MRRISVSPGKNRITIEGLVPKTKYIACVCVKGLIPKKEQCVIFSTDEAASASGTQKLINVVVISVACVIAVSSDAHRLLRRAQAEAAEN